MKTITITSSPNNSVKSLSTEETVPIEEKEEELIEVGDRVNVKYGKGRVLKIYEAKVLKITKASPSNGNLKQFQVHYTGWNTRYDEWVTRLRIVKHIPEKEVCSGSKKRSNNNNNNNNNSASKSSNSSSVSIPMPKTPAKRGRPPLSHRQPPGEKQLRSSDKTSSPSTRKRVRHKSGISQTSIYTESDTSDIEEMELEKPPQVEEPKTLFTIPIIKEEPIKEEEEEIENEDEPWDIDSETYDANDNALDTLNTDDERECSQYSELSLKEEKTPYEMKESDITKQDDSEEKGVEGSLDDSFLQRPESEEMDNLSQIEDFSEPPILKSQNMEKLELKDQNAASNSENELDMELPLIDMVQPGLSNKDKPSRLAAKKIEEEQNKTDNSKKDRINSWLDNLKRTADIEPEEGQETVDIDEVEEELLAIDESMDSQTQETTVTLQAMEEEEISEISAPNSQNFVILEESAKEPENSDIAFLICKEEVPASPEQTTSCVDEARQDAMETLVSLSSGLNEPNPTFQGSSCAIANRSPGQIQEISITPPLTPDSSNSQYSTPELNNPDEYSTGRDSLDSFSLTRKTSDAQDLFQEDLSQTASQPRGNKKRRREESGDGSYKKSKRPRLFPGSSDPSFSPSNRSKPFKNGFFCRDYTAKDYKRNKPDMCTDIEILQGEILIEELDVRMSSVKSFYNDIKNHVNEMDRKQKLMNKKKNTKL